MIMSLIYLGTLVHEESQVEQKQIKIFSSKYINNVINVCNK